MLIKANEIKTYQSETDQDKTSALHCKWICKIGQGSGQRV